MKRQKNTGMLINPRGLYFDPEGENERELPWWMTRWVPQWLLNIMPEWLFERIVILGTLRGRGSGELITHLKIYFGHTATALSLGMAADWSGRSMWAAGLAGVVWWVAAEILDTITYGFSLDMLYDGLEYSGGFLPILAYAAMESLGLPQHAPLVAWATFVAWFSVWFKLLPQRTRVG